MTCFVCGKDESDYKLLRYSPLGYEGTEDLCRACVYAAFPPLKAKEDAEHELERKHQEREAKREAAMEHLRAAPTPKEYKRRRQEMIEQGIA